MTLKVDLSGGGGCSALSDQVSAFQYCIDNNIKVSNNSWGTPNHCQCLYDVIKEARDQIGHIVVASAGNQGTDNDVIRHYPASYGWTHQVGTETIEGLDNVIAVAATDFHDNLADWDFGQSSNFGSESVHLAAPGKNIWTTRPFANAPGYGYFQGTSSAAPHVTGVVALLWSRIPSLTYTQVRNQVLNSVRPVPALAGKTITGGVVNAYQALLWDCEGNCSNAACIGVGPDCNTNGVYDGCDIASGFDCDLNLDGLPDTCGACCGEFGVCENRTQGACDPANGETWVAGIACSDCSCAPAVCCQGEMCGVSTTDCECIASGGYPRLGVSFCGTPVEASPTCRPGVCCNDDQAPTVCGEAQNGSSDCSPSERYIGGPSVCDPNVCSVSSCPYACCSDGDCNTGQGEICCCGVCKRMNTCSDPDCNANNVSDTFDTSECTGEAFCRDCDSNGIPDICWGSGDADFDCTVDVDDLNFCNDCLEGPGVDYPLGTKCIYLDMDKDHDVDSADCVLLEAAQTTTSPACDGSEPPLCTEPNYKPVLAGTTLGDSVVARIYPNPFWEDGMILDTSGRELVYRNDPLLPNVELSIDPLPSFLYWSVDGVPQTAGQTAIEVSPSQTDDVKAVFLEIESDPTGVLMNRFISFTTPDSIGGNTAIRVTLTSLHHPANPVMPPPDFSAWEGQVRYVNSFKDGAGFPVLDCPDSEILGNSFKCATLGCKPEYLDWGGLANGEVLYVTAAEIIPSSTYGVEVLGESCSGVEATCSAVSSSLSLSTGVWGDVDQNPDYPGVNVLDIAEQVDKVKDLPWALPEPQTMLVENAPRPDSDKIDVVDLTKEVDAVKYFAYPFMGPCSCPSTISCGSISCLWQGDCPGGFCVFGYCVDECYRCDAP